MSTITHAASVALYCKIEKNGKYIDVLITNNIYKKCAKVKCLFVSLFACFFGLDVKLIEQRQNTEHSWSISRVQPSSLNTLVYNES